MAQSKLHSLFKKSKGDLLIFAAMLIFGSSALFLRKLPDIPVPLFLFSFQLIGFIGFFLLFLRQRNKGIPKKELTFLLTLAVVALGNDLAYFSAFRLTTIANAALAHQMVSLFILFLAPLLLKEKTKKYELAPVFISLAGLVLLYGRNLTFYNISHLIGLSFGLLSALLYALLIIHYRYLTGRKLTVTTINLWRYGFSSLILLPFILNPQNFQVATSNMYSLVAFGLIFAVIASGLHNYGIGLSKSIRAAVIGQIEPVVATFYAFLFLKEIPTIETLLGGAMILGASFWLTLKTTA